MLTRSNSFYYFRMRQNPPKDGFERRTLRKRDDILAAADMLFRKNGIRQSSMTRIAKSAHVSPVTIFKYFKDKHGLVEEVIRTALSAAVLEYEQILQSSAPFQERLKHFLDLKDRNAKNFGGDFVATLYQEYPDLASDFHEERARLFRQISEPFLDEGRASGYLSAEVSNQAILLLMELLHAGLQKNSSLAKKITTEAHLSEELAHLMRNGILRRSP